MIRASEFILLTEIFGAIFCQSLKELTKWGVMKCLLYGYIPSRKLVEDSSD